jgi:putative ABC transport system permease protein
MAMATIGVLSIDEIARVAHLSDGERTLVERGGLVVRDADLAPGGRVTAVTGLMRFDEQTGAAVTKDLRTTTLSAVVRDPKMSGMNLGGLVTPETAQRHGWPTTRQSMLIRDADGPISVEDQEKLGELLGDDGGVYVERGFQRDDIWPMRILFGGFGFLLLVVTLISTSLSLAEQQSDMGTFAAVGATRRTRSSLAAAQAMVVGLIGALLGIAVGLVPGIAMSYPLTTLSWDPMTGEQVRADPITVIPWLPLALIVIGVPLLAGLLSAAAVRRAPAMTRRAD